MDYQLRTTDLKWYNADIQVRKFVAATEIYTKLLKLNNCLFYTL